MTSSQGHVLLLVGSAKRPRSTSESLGTYLGERLGERRFEAETLLLHRALKSDASADKKHPCEELLAAADRADVLVIAFPLYVDSLPYLVIQAMEHIARHRKDAHRQARGKGKSQRLVAIVNCGFPEARQNDTALAICRQFAREAGFEWAGGLALGGGEAIRAWAEGLRPALAGS
jgi:putative NADPH-quinone reductase